MKFANVLFLFIGMLLLLNISAQQVSACGCGLAISEAKVFNALKETQAYLLIDIQNETSYNEMPFFRMVSMEEPYNVTIVFPISEIPYGVEGKTISANKFLKDYKIGEAENYIMKQKFSNAAKRVGDNLKTSSPGVFFFSNGFAGGFIYAITTSVNFGAKGFDTNRLGVPGGLNPIAHFEFEGGNLDIYDVKSMDTLDEFVKTINITITEKVQELVTKYNKYYVAVLYLNVPSVLDEKSRNQLKTCPEQTEQVKKALQEKTVFSYGEINALTGGICSEPLQKLIYSVTSTNSELNGTLVNMKFSGTENFFYPTSIVNSYKYPITDQKYFVKTPSSIHINLESSKISETASFDNERWYRVNSTEDDMKGKIVSADLEARFGDGIRTANQAIYDNSVLIVLIIYLLIILMPLTYYRFKIKETLSGWNIGVAALLFVVGGFLLSSIILFFMKKRKLALVLFLIWLLLLVLSVMFAG
jgi:hypothetical protein